MQTEVILQPSFARCYICNQSENIEQVCHHCGRSICKEHATTFRWIRPMIRSREFKDLGLDKQQKAPVPVHCKKCLRNFYAYWFFLIASILCFFGSTILLYGGLLHYHIIDEIVFTIFNTYALVDKFRPKAIIDTSILILLVGLLFYALHFSYWFIHFIKHRPPFPIIPNMDSINIVETMHGSLCLDEQGKYTMAATSLAGKFTAPLQFVVRDRKRWKRHLARYRLFFRPNLSLHAGFVVFKEAANIKLGTSSDFSPMEPTNTFTLLGKVGDHLFLTDKTLTHTHHWDAQLPYNIERFDGKKIPLPIQIIPTLVQDDTQRSIGLVIQLSPQFNKLIKFERAVIKEFTLLAPSDLGKVLLTSPDASIGTNPIRKLKVVWKDLELDVTQNAAKNFSIQFGNPINQTTKLAGGLQINFTGSFSGLKNVEYFYPWGQKYTKAKTDREAIVHVDFELSLESLRFQKLYPKAQIHRYQHVLNHSLIRELTSRLENSKFYIRRVIENPAHTNPANAYLVNRLWDLAGRYYEGVYPIDFHLVLTGEEVINKPGEGKLMIDFNVQAMTTSDPLRAKVDLLYKRLVEIVKDTL